MKCDDSSIYAVFWDVNEITQLLNKPKQNKINKLKKKKKSLKAFFIHETCFELRKNDHVCKNCQWNWSTYNVLMWNINSSLAQSVLVQAASSLATITNPVFGQHLLSIYEKF